MKKTFSLYLTLLLVSNACAQSVNPLSVEPVLKIVVPRGKSVSFKVQAKIEPGYHVNSNKPNEDYLIPMRMTWQSDPLVVESVKYPVGHDEKYAFSEKPLNVLTGNFEILVTVKAPEKIEPQMHVMLGKLRYQACSDKACLVPKTIEVRVTADLR